MPCGFVKELGKFDKFRIHTGNVNSYVELKLKRFKDSAEELSACLDIQLKSPPSFSGLTNDSTLCLDPNNAIDHYERGDLKITLKVFLSSWDPEEMKEAVDCLMSELSTKNIELLIVSTPELDVIDEESEEDELKRWKDTIDPIWKYLCGLVDEGRICTLGIAEANVSQLRILVEDYDIRPTVDHLRHDGCCAVPTELRQFANSVDISLLTHNDPYPFPTREVFRTFCEMNDNKEPVCCPLFETRWAARYTVWVRRRSVMASKGYLVQFTRKN